MTFCGASISYFSHKRCSLLQKIWGQFDIIIIIISNCFEWQLDIASQ